MKLFSLLSIFMAGLFWMPGGVVLADAPGEPGSEPGDGEPAAEAARPDPMSDRNQIVGVINGRPVTLFEIDERIRPQLAELRKNHQGLELAAEKMTLRKRALRERIDELLLLEEAQQSIPEAKMKQIDFSVDAMVKGMIREMGSLVLFQQKLKQQGKTLEDVRKETREDEIIREFVSDRINRRIVVTPRDIRAYYEEHIDDYKFERMVHVRAILISFERFPGDAALKEAREAAEKLRGGSDFAKMAARYPGSPRSDEGGDFGFIKPPYFEEGVDKVLFALEPHTVPEPIRTKLGYFVVRVDAEKPARQSPLEDVQDEIMKRLHDKQHQTLLKEFLQELYSDAVVRTVW